MSGEPVTVTRDPDGTVHLRFDGEVVWHLARDSDASLSLAPDEAEALGEALLDAATYRVATLAGEPPLTAAEAHTAAWAEKQELNR